MKYAIEGLAFTVVRLHYQFLEISYHPFTHILQDCFTGTGAIVLPQCQLSNPEEYGWNWSIISTTKQQSANPLRWRHNGRDSVSNYQPHECLLNRLFRRRSKKASKIRVTGLCVGNSPGTGEFPAQMASNAENVPIWWRHHACAQL